MGKDLGRVRAAERRVWERLGITPVDRRVRLPSGGEVRVQEVGEGRPVVFLHGGSIAGTSWCDLAAGLRDVRCILVDRPGCGFSDPIVDGPLRDLVSVQRFADRLVLVRGAEHAPWIDDLETCVDHTQRFLAA